MATHGLTAWTFRRAIALVYLLAFSSLAVQILGLIGASGILPAQTYLDAIRTHTDSSVGRVLIAPTLSWIAASDASLKAQCVGGVALSVLLLVGVAPLVVTPLLWLLYLSIAVVGQGFLAYQWDALLLEAGFLAIFIAPAVRFDRLHRAAEPNTIGVWLFKWLLARLMLASGAIKLTSGDPTWSSLTALAFHYETQPLPTPLAWYAHHLPLWFHKATTAATLAIELVAPLLMLGPRRLRLTAAALIVGLQVMIALTGNYAFFGLLTASLCVFLLDDDVLARAMRKAAPAAMRVRGQGDPRTSISASARKATPALVIVAIATLPISFFATSRALGLDLPRPRVVTAIAQYTAPFLIANSYGLFAVMTTSRPELVVEGSMDGKAWLPYEFKFKPGDPRRRPPWVAPHQPRLDWDLWFAALDSYEANPWVGRFLVRLLEGSPEVLDLVTSAPWGSTPPRYVRIVRYRYRFASRTDRATTGAWWTRELTDEYSPVLTLP